jgi:hypothetical protein
MAMGCACLRGLRLACGPAYQEFSNVAYGLSPEIFALCPICTLRCVVLNGSLCPSQAVFWLDAGTAPRGRDVSPRPSY